MFDSVREVVMLPTNGLEQIIDEVNFKYNQREGDPEWFDPEEFMYLFWTEQEFGTDCWMKLDVSEGYIEREKIWLEECKIHPALSHSVYIGTTRVRVLEYIRARIPSHIDIVMVPIEY